MRLVFLCLIFLYIFEQISAQTVDVNQMRSLSDIQLDAMKRCLGVAPETDITEDSSSFNATKATLCFDPSSPNYFLRGYAPPAVAGDVNRKFGEDYVGNGEYFGSRATSKLSLYANVRGREIEGNDEFAKKFRDDITSRIPGAARAYFLESHLNGIEKEHVNADSVCSTEIHGYLLKTSGGYERYKSGTLYFWCGDHSCCETECCSLDFAAVFYWIFLVSFFVMVAIFLFLVVTCYIKIRCCDSKRDEKPTPTSIEQATPPQTEIQQ